MDPSLKEAQNVSKKDTRPRSAMASPNLAGISPRLHGNTKVVSIVEPGSINSHTPGSAGEDDGDREATFNIGPHAYRPKPKKHRVKLGRLGSRSSLDLPRARTPADILHLHAQDGTTQINGDHALGTTTLAPSKKAQATSDSADKQGNEIGGSKSKHTLPKGHLTYHDLMKWIQREKSRRASSKAHKKDKKRAKQEGRRIEKKIDQAPLDEETSDDGFDQHERRASDASSEGSVALEMLQDILQRNAGIFSSPFANHSSTSIRRPGSLRKSRRTSTIASSDTDFYDGEPSVPSCEVVLDNSKTVAASQDETGSRPDLNRTVSFKDTECWKQFKYETVRLAHTLKVKGWRRVPMSRSDDIKVDRLSGALTNSVYVVTPPLDLMKEQESEGKPDKRPKPRKLLLRIYGAQVEHLIDRESELAILRRLSKKRIGPRMLGTFKNGRFEEHFHARALSAKELREPSCSRQIAKRMRELHDGIELLNTEVAAGPFVWQNIDKWMRRAEKIVEWVECNKDVARPSHARVIAADFELFKEALRRYRKWLEENYSGWDAIRERLVFAHNDAQYGNILRLEGEDESKITPEDEHKQLIVIDFEYANANVPGLEFANHFTEWCYNYHDATTSFSCNVPLYPNPDQQTNFFAAYVSHQPSFPPARGSLSQRASTTSLASLATSVPTTPSSMHPTTSAVGMISSFMLEARSQPASGSTPTLTSHNNSNLSTNATFYDPAEEGVHADIRAREIERLRWETRAWRGVNSAQWVLWGIVQAKVEGMPDFADDVSPAVIAQEETSSVQIPSRSVEEDPKRASETAPTMESDAPITHEDDDEEFDYLQYAFERARFFWGDILALGIMNEDEIPQDVRALARVLDY